MQRHEVQSGDAAMSAEASPKPCGQARVLPRLHRMDNAWQRLTTEIRDLESPGGVLFHPEWVGRIADQVAVLRTAPLDELGILADALEQSPVELDRDLQLIERFCQSMSPNGGSTDRRGNHLAGMLLDQSLVVLKVCLSAVFGDSAGDDGARSAAGCSNSDGPSSDAQPQGHRPRESAPESGMRLG